MRGEHVPDRSRAGWGWDVRYGGGLMREAVTAQLRYCAELLHAQCPE